jgi:hypothetical protein
MRYWNSRANELKEKELAGKINANLNSAKARQRADELEARLKQRLGELKTGETDFGITAGFGSYTL